MDNKRLIILMAVALAILLGWNYFVSYMAKRHNWATGPETQPAQVQPAASATPQAIEKAATLTSAPAPSGMLHIIGAAPSAQVARLGSDQMNAPGYSLGVHTQSQGASILAVTLNQFPKSLEEKQKPYVFQQPANSGIPSMATLAATVNGQTVDLGNANWLLQRSDAQSAVYRIEIGAEKPLTAINKTIQITGRDDKKTQGYEVLVRHSIDNLTKEAVEVSLTMSGPTTPPSEVTRGQDRYVLMGYNDLPDWDPPKIKAEAITVETVKEAKSIEKSAKDWPLIWTGLTSAYFDALLLPVAKDMHRTAPFIESIRVEPAGAITPGSHDVQMQIVTRKISLAAGNPSVDLDMLAFFGPKARVVVKDDYYASYPRQYDLSLTTSGACCPSAMISPIIDVMVNLLRAFHFVLRDWGLAIIALVIVVRALMHPLTRKSTISMHKMSKLAPEIERIKKKYADNPEEQQRAMMQFYKEHGAGQLLGCLPMFIQMPIWIALWSSLQSTFELRLAPFLWGFTWIKDLAKPDRLITFPPINLWFFTLDSVNILPIGMAVVFYLQQKFTPQAAAAATPEQEQQQKMMKWMMTLMFPLMLYTGPSGLNLYIFTSTLVGILESKWIRDHIKAREAAQAAAGPVIIDAPATRGARRRQENEPAVKKPKGRLAQWWENIQKMAADAQKRQQNKGRK